ncbi:uncharacterized protein LOC119178669 isoform X9 [Rhipicephalus microplus]|uniref:uncharacterized protein LOC119178669 isoform X9 n=1 Tax=Rhipicephalus microplus TaxID=6941 RepID=UPI003F6D3589
MTTPASGKGIPDLASTSTRKVLQEQDVIGAMNVDIKVERSSPPTLPPPWLICVGIKEEPVIPPTTESLDVNVDIKVEQSSPPTTPLPDMSVDVKVEPRSPTATPPPGPIDMDRQGPAEPQDLVPAVVPPTTSTYSTETTGDAAVIDSDKRNMLIQLKKERLRQHLAVAAVKLKATPRILGTCLHE